MNSDDLDWAKEKFKAKLGWVIELRCWDRVEYAEHIAVSRREFFFD
jgi:hypothetical protein